MAYAGSEDVMGVIETLVKEVWNEIYPGSIDQISSFIRMTYNDAMTQVFTIFF
jgi:aspartyl-tRNA synthetase